MAIIDPEAARRSKMTWEEKVKEDCDYENMSAARKAAIDEMLASYNS
ncbi:MAG: hypothetical protein RR859_08520 [Ruthenibacterium sp.]